MSAFSLRKLLKDDLNINCHEMANYLLGKLLVRKLENGKILKGRIVETECYLGGEDKASHSYNNRQTPTNLPMYMDPGTCYVYMTYGMYYCFNISSKEPGAAVLLRALDPVEGIEEMIRLRTSKQKNKEKVLKENELCNGPSKLCMAMDIKKENINKLNLTDDDNDCIWLEDDPDFDNFETIVSTRIGIASAGEEWSKKPLRFYIYKNDHVSKKDKKAEKEFQLNNSEIKS